ncbi:MAG: hypothetical protein HY096_00405 [Nitrospinae bacterium]|nr:hypothetical protein [Nitrospinota bacterium]
MKINILTPDSKKPNLAAMKISSYHKAQGDEIYLNFPLLNVDYTYASILFQKTKDPIADLIGGPKYPEIKLPQKIDEMKPDYSLYPFMDYSLGYTYKACSRRCPFCVVPRQKNEDTHYSIWSFHDAKFHKIGLLNNNTLADPRWRETFNEIWDANLILIDLSGFDARLITDESAEYIRGTKIWGQIHIAWDFIGDEDRVMRGVNCLLKAGVSPYKITCYVLMGYKSTEAEDLFRLRKLKDINILSFAMPYRKEVLPPVFLRAINKPQIQRGLDMSGDTYRSITRQIKRAV